MTRGTVAGCKTCGRSGMRCFKFNKKNTSAGKSGPRKNFEQLLKGRGYDQGGRCHCVTSADAVHRREPDLLEEP